MKTTHYLMFFGLLVLGVVAPGATATAQNRRRPRDLPQVQYDPPRAFNGEVVQIKMPFLYAISADKSQWVIKLEPETPDDITLKGEAKLSWLQKGMLLQFEAVLDKRFTSQQPVKTFKVLMTPPNGGLGVTQDAPVSADDVPMAFVVGAFSRMRDGILFVQAGKRLVKVRPSEDAEIEVVAMGPGVFKILRPGDKVAGKIRPVQGVLGQAKAKTLEFQGAKVYGEEAVLTPSRRKTTRRRRPADDQGGENHRDKQSEDSTPGKGVSTKHANHRASVPRSSRSV